MDNTFIQERITKTKELIIAYEDAILALSGGAQDYRLDTGQSIIKVTKFDLKDMNTMIDSLYNRCATLEARLTGGGTVTGVPAW